MSHDPENKVVVFGEFAPPSTDLCHIWKSAVGSGSAVEYLQWLAAQWELWCNTSSEGRAAANARANDVDLWAAMRDVSICRFTRWVRLRFAGHM